MYVVTFCFLTYSYASVHPLVHPLRVVPQVHYTSTHHKTHTHHGGVGIPLGVGAGATGYTQGYTHVIATRGIGFKVHLPHLLETFSKIFPKLSLVNSICDETLFISGQRYCTLLMPPVRLPPQKAQHPTHLLLY
jgi:hypothetical protein